MCDSQIKNPEKCVSREVGLFYFLWLGEHGRHKPYDISKITALHPDAGYHPDDGYFGGIGVYHHWGEPFYGYYYSDDEWVVRRHMKLIMQAGVDFLYFDTTNALIYENNAKLVMRVLEEYFLLGHRIPKVMFYTNTASGATVRKLYDAIYRDGFCRDTWFMIDGRPAVIAFPEELDDELRGFFTVKLPQWPNEPAKVGGWPWMDFTKPQRIFTNAAGEPECISVSVAQHPQLRFGDSVLYGEEGNCGRAYHNGANDRSPDAYRYCFNFTEQFERALKSGAPYIMVTGWNEWIAGRWQGIPERPVMFVDCANYEYSRDIEMMRGGYFDNYYRCLCKFTAAAHNRSDDAVRTATLSIGDTVSFIGYTDGAMRRDHEGYGCRYENHTGRHAIDRISAGRGEDSLTLTLHTTDNDFSDRSGTFMTLYLRTEDGEPSRFTIGTYDFERCTAVMTVKTQNGESSVTIPARIEQDEASDGYSISVDVPVTAFGGSEKIYLKAADSTDAIVTPEDLYDHGDVLPLGYGEFAIKLTR